MKRINATDRINDLNEIKIGPLRRKDAITFISDLLKTKVNNSPDEDVSNYILDKIEWWIPFYFQLLVKEMGELIHFDEAPMNRNTVDKAFAKMVENGDIYFEHFKSRLRKTFEGNELKFVLELLKTMKINDGFAFNAIADLAEKHGMRDGLDEILEILRYDGYIVSDNGNFKFYSPILKSWWK
jgi:uncharacterized protein